MAPKLQPLSERRSDRVPSAVREAATWCQTSSATDRSPISQEPRGTQLLSG